MSRRDRGAGPASGPSSSSGETSTRHPFRLVALPRETFAPLFALDDAALREHGACRMRADGKPGDPCRVSLIDAEPGEAVIGTRPGRSIRRGLDFDAQGATDLDAVPGRPAIATARLPGALGLASHHRMP